MGDLAVRQPHLGQESVAALARVVASETEGVPQDDVVPYVLVRLLRCGYVRRREQASTVFVSTPAGIARARQEAAAAQRRLAEEERREIIRGRVQAMIDRMIDDRPPPPALPSLRDLPLYHDPRLPRGRQPQPPPMPQRRLSGPEAAAGRPPEYRALAAPEAAFQALRDSDRRRREALDRLAGAELPSVRGERLAVEHVGRLPPKRGEPANGPPREAAASGALPLVPWAETPETPAAEDPAAEARPPEAPVPGQDGPGSQQKSGGRAWRGGVAAVAITGGALLAAAAVAYVHDAPPLWPTSPAGAPFAGTGRAAVPPPPALQGVAWRDAQSVQTGAVRREVQGARPVALRPDAEGARPGPVRQALDERHPSEADAGSPGRKALPDHARLAASGSTLSPGTPPERLPPGRSLPLPPPLPGTTPPAAPAAAAAAAVTPAGPVPAALTVGSAPAGKPAGHGTLPLPPPAARRAAVVMAAPLAPAPVARAVVRAAAVPPIAVGDTQGPPAAMPSLSVQNGGSVAAGHSPGAGPAAYPSGVGPAALHPALGPAQPRTPPPPAPARRTVEAAGQAGDRHRRAVSPAPDAARARVAAAALPEPPPAQTPSQVPRIPTAGTAAPRAAVQRIATAQVIPPVAAQGAPITAVALPPPAGGPRPGPVRPHDATLDRVMARLRAGKEPDNTVVDVLNTLSLRAALAGRTFSPVDGRRGTGAVQSAAAATAAFEP